MISSGAIPRALAPADELQPFRVLFGVLPVSERTSALQYQLQIENCARFGSLGQKAQGMAHYVALSLHIPHPSDSTTQKVRGHDSPGHLQVLGVMPKGANVDDYGRNAILLQDSGGVSHGHMADWSGGD